MSGPVTIWPMVYASDQPGVYEYGAQVFDDDDCILIVTGNQYLSKDIEVLRAVMNSDDERISQLVVSALNDGAFVRDVWFDAKDCEWALEEE